MANWPCGSVEPHDGHPGHQVEPEQPAATPAESAEQREQNLIQQCDMWHDRYLDERGAAAQARHERDQARAEVDQLRARVAELETEPDQLRVKVADLGTRLVELEGEREQALAEVDRWARAAADARAERDELRVQVANLHHERDRLHGDLFAARRERSLARKQLVTIRQRLIDEGWRLLQRPDHPPEAPDTAWWMRQVADGLPAGPEPATDDPHVVRLQHRPIDVHEVMVVDAARWHVRAVCGHLTEDPDAVETTRQELVDAVAALETKEDSDA